MPGGLLILAAVGSESLNLIGNPQLTFFKMVYKHHTNFATEPIELALDGTPELDFENGPLLKCVVNRHADLLSHMYLLVDIPDIYSGYDTTIEPNMGYQFQWIQQLGTQMIDHVDLFIGGQLIQRLQGNYIQLWHELYSPNGKDISLFQRMSGNTVEMYNPSDSVWMKGIYPTSTLDPSLSTDPEIQTSITPSSNISNPYYRTASIRGRTLYIPLPFWFSQNSGQALPLVALQKNETQIQIQFRPLRELYRVRDTDHSSITFGSHIAPQLNNPKQNINSFIPSSGKNAVEQRSNMQNQNGVSFKKTNISSRNQKLNINPRLLCTYVFLDEKEQQRFATTNHKYLIEKMDYQQEGGIYNTTTFPLQLRHPTKSIIWFLQNEDVSSRNDWSNYTNWKTSFGTPPFSLSAYVPEYGEDISQIVGETTDSITNIPIHFSQYHPTNAQNIMTKFDYPNTEQHILKEATILLNGIELFTTRKAFFFEYLQAYEHEYKRSVPGVYSYSFSLLPRQFQPSGSCDMSRVKQAQLQIVTQDTNTDAVLKYSLNVISVHYNVLEIMGGMGHLEYAD